MAKRFIKEFRIDRMEFLTTIITIIKSPLGSIALRLIIPLIRAGIKWTPTKKDDEVILKIDTIIKKYVTIFLDEKIV